MKAFTRFALILGLVLAMTGCGCMDTANAKPSGTVTTPSAQPTQASAPETTIPHSSGTESTQSTDVTRATEPQEETRDSTPRSRRNQAIPLP